MEIEINGLKQQAEERNGKFQHTFTPTNPNDKIKLYHMGCVGDTRLSHIQLEQGNDVTAFEMPTQKANSLSGIFKQLRDLDVQMRDTNSEFWGRVKLNNKGMLLEFQNKELKNILANTAEGFNLTLSKLEDKVVKKNDVIISADGITIGTGKKIDGNTISSLFVTKPESITAISKLFKVTGDMIVDGTLRTKHFGANVIEAGNINGGAIYGRHIQAEAIEGHHMKINQAMINKLLANDIFVTSLFAKDAFIKNLKAVKISATQLEADFLRAYKGYIGGFQIGRHEKDASSAWLTGENQFYVGMSNGNGTRGQTALWVNWGTAWDKIGDNAWFVKENGKMYCYNQAEFWKNPIIHGDLQITGNIFYDNGAKSKGVWIHSPQYHKVENAKGFIYFYYSGGGYDWVDANKEISDRRYKRNIKNSNVKALDVINNLRTYSYTKDYDNKIKDIQCGIMAQDVKRYVSDAFKELPDGTYSYSSFEMIPYLVKGIQELSEQNNILLKEMEILRNER